MKYFLKLAATLALVVSIAATGFAVVNPNTKLKLNDTLGKQTTKRKLIKLNNHGAKKIGHKRRASVLRVRRLTERQRKEVFRRLIDISIN